MQLVMEDCKMPVGTSPAPAVMSVYDGTTSLGEIEDHGPGDVRAFVGIGDERKPIGAYPDRRTAMRAVSEARKRLMEPAPFRSGLPE
jgi:hypothetical protein